MTVQPGSGENRADQAQNPPPSATRKTGASESARPVPGQGIGAWRGTRRGALMLVTLARIPIAFGFLLLLLLTPQTTNVLISALILLAVVEWSDFVDGFLARRFGLVTELGATVDPYADSVARFFVFIGLAYDGLALMVVPLTMAFRDVTVAYARILTVRGGRTASARWSGKIKAAVQAVGGFVLLLGPFYWRWTGEGAVIVISWLIASLTLLSAIEYVVGALRAYREKIPG